MKLSRFEESVLAYIDTYRVVTLRNLLSRFPHASKATLISVTSNLAKSGQVQFKASEYHISSETYYFSNQFNKSRRTNVFGNDILGLEKCLIALDSFRAIGIIRYEQLGFFPTAIRFGLMDNKNHVHNAQLIYLPYSDKNELIKYIASRLDYNYDEVHKPIRYIVLESYGMLTKKTAEDIETYIPRVREIIYCPRDEIDAKFYSVSDLKDGGVENG